MPISFQCPQCGKKLKAPDAAAGKSSKCPGCGGTVTCPEPVYDAEVVEMELAPEKPAGFNPFADLDDDKPYGVATPQPVEQSSDDGRRPCPMCGELIVATAARRSVRTDDGHGQPLRLRGQRLLWQGRDLSVAHVMRARPDNSCGRQQPKRRAHQPDRGRGRHRRRRAGTH